MDRKRIAVLGSTGSIGTQTLDIIHRSPDRFRVTALTCGQDVNRLIDQIASFSEEDTPELAVCANKKDMARIKSAFPDIRV